MSGDNNSLLSKILALFKNKKVLVLLIILIILAVIGYASLASSVNIGNTSPISSNLTLNYNNDKSAYYMQEISTGRNLGDGYINKEEYVGVIEIDLSKVNWIQTNESDVDYAKEYSANELEEALKNSNQYVSSIRVYDENSNQVGSVLTGHDMKISKNGDIIQINVNANHSSDLILTKNNCDKASYAEFKLEYHYGNNNYTITSNLTGDNFIIKHI